MTRCESYPPCFETIYFPTAPFCRFLSPLFYQEKHATAKCKKLACKQCPQIAKNPELRNQKKNTTDSYCQGEQIDQKSFSGKIQTI